MPGYGKIYGSTFVLEAGKSGRQINVDYTLDLTVTTYKDTPDHPCHSADSYYPLSQCIDEYVEAKLNCKQVVQCLLNKLHTNLNSYHFQ